MKYVLVLSVVFFLCGCMAVVDEENRVTSYGLSKEETLDILERADRVPSQEKKEIIFFEKKEVKE